MQIPFYYDYACPWAYIGSCRVESYFADLGAEIDFRPVRLAQLVENPGPRGLPPGERKKQWYVSDLRAWAELAQPPWPHPSLPHGQTPPMPKQ